MPRPRFSNRLVADTFTIPAGSAVDVIVDLQDSFYPQLMVKVTYPATSNPAGVTCTIYPGFAVDNLQTIEFSDNGNSVTEFAQTLPTPSLGTQQIKRTAFAVNAEVYPRHIKLHLVNTDTTNAVAVRIVGDW